jgi:hypothetical protein
MHTFVANIQVSGYSSRLDFSISNNPYLGNSDEGLFILL